MVEIKKHIIVSKKVHKELKKRALEKESTIENGVNQILIKEFGEKSE